jgi:hypothetical protein
MNIKLIFTLELGFSYIANVQTSFHICNYQNISQLLNRNKVDLLTLYLAIHVKI